MKDLEIQESQIRQFFASVVWTHKIQEKQSDIYRKNYKKMSAITIVFQALTASGIFSILFVDEYCLKIISAIISAISLFISIYCETFNLSEEASYHKNTATTLFILREKIINLLSDIHCDKMSYEDVINRKENLMNEYFEICKSARDASKKAVDMATEDLKVRFHNTYTDEEIDSFLPVLLRKLKEKENEHK